MQLYNVCKKTLEKQKAFVSPSTKELQRKSLGNLTIFAYIISRKIQRNVFLSICSSHATN